MINFIGKPLTVERVVEAYEQTGLTPQARTYFDPEKNCGCALGAVMLSDLGGLDIGINYMTSDNWSGFTHGFDGKPKDVEGPATYHEAFDLGVACRKAVGLGE